MGRLHEHSYHLNTHRIKRLIKVDGCPRSFYRLVTRCVEVTRSPTSCVLSFRTNCDGERLRTEGSATDRVCTSQKAAALTKAALEPVFLTHRHALLTRPTAASLIVAA